MGMGPSTQCHNCYIFPRAPEASNGVIFEVYEDKLILLGIRVGQHEGEQSRAFWAMLRPRMGFSTRPELRDYGIPARRGSLAHNNMTVSGLECHESLRSDLVF